MRKSFAAIALVLSGALLAGCSTGDNNGDNTPAGANPDAVINIQVGLEPTSLDVANTSGAAIQQVLVGNVYEGLVARDQNGKISAALATDWKISEDGLTYEFELRSAKFHDGTEVTPAAVVKSLQAAAAEGSKNPDAKRMTVVESISADGNKISIKLKNKDINFLNTLTGAGGLVFPENPGVDLANQSNGSGPYKVAEWNKGATITLERNDDYWGEKPKNKTVIFNYISDATTAATALQQGEVDLIGGANAETVELFANNPAFTVTTGDSTSWMVFGFNHEHPALKDPKVRQALTLAINRDGLISVLGGQGLNVGTITVPSDSWHVDMSGFASYDPEKAKQLLKEAGQENLKLTLTVSNTYENTIPEYIAAQLAEVGVTLEINSVEFATWLEQAFNGRNYEVTMVLQVDPWILTYYGLADGYYWNYKNPEVKALIDAARESATLEERDEKMRQAAKLVAEDYASIWLYSPKTNLISAAEVSGYPTNRLSNHFLVSGITSTK